MSVHQRVSVNAISSRSWPLADDVALCRRLGVSLIGVAMNKLIEAGEIGIELLDGARRDGLDVSTLLAGVSFGLGDPDSWPASRAALIDAARLAARIGAPSLFITTGRPPSRMATDDCIDAFCRAVSPGLAAIADTGVRFAIEHSSTMTHDGGCVHSLADAIEVAEELDVGLVIELQNCWLERNLTELFRRAASRAVLVQVNDFVVGTNERLSRAVPGDGDMPLEWLIGALIDAGYQGAFDIELVGPRIEIEGYESAIERSVAWVTECLGRLGA